MTAFLLDVNVLVALCWPGHEAYERVQVWFARNAHQGWATCPFTQSAFIRIVSNPAFSQRAVSPQDAIRALDISMNHPAHRFWPAEIQFQEAVSSFQSRVIGHQQVTDAYLLGLTLHKKGRLATLDRSVVALLPPGSRDRDRVEIIQKAS